jgi:hypothetical protein
MHDNDDLPFDLLFSKICLLVECIYVGVSAHHFSGVVQAMINGFLFYSLVARQSRVALGVFLLQWERSRLAAMLAFEPSFPFPGGCVFWMSF